MVKQREATFIAAGELVGLDVLKSSMSQQHVVAYGLNQKEELFCCLVFDLGGGTFDVTIISDGNRIRVIATDGNHNWEVKIGTIDLCNMSLRGLKRKYGVDPLQNIKAEYELRAPL